MKPAEKVQVFAQFEHLPDLLLDNGSWFHRAYSYPEAGGVVAVFVKDVASYTM